MSPIDGLALDRDCVTLYAYLPILHLSRTAQKRSQGDLSRPVSTWALPISSPKLTLLYHFLKRRGDLRNLRTRTDTALQRTVSSGPLPTGAHPVVGQLITSTCATCFEVSRFRSLEHRDRSKTRKDGGDVTLSSTQALLLFASHRA